MHGEGRCVERAGRNRAGRRAAPRELMLGGVWGRVLEGGREGGRVTNTYMTQTTAAQNRRHPRPRPSLPAPARRPTAHLSAPPSGIRVSAVCYRIEMLHPALGNTNLLSFPREVVDGYVTAMQAQFSQVRGGRGVRPGRILGGVMGGSWPGRLLGRWRAACKRGPPRWGMAPRGSGHGRSCFAGLFSQAPLHPSSGNTPCCCTTSTTCVYTSPAALFCAATCCAVRPRRAAPLQAQYVLNSCDAYLSPSARAEMAVPEPLLQEVQRLRQHVHREMRAFAEFKVGLGGGRGGGVSGVTRAAC